VGKSYACRKPIEERPESDFYRTPSSLVEMLVSRSPDLARHYNNVIYEPMAGDGVIVDMLREYGYEVEADDIRTTGKDFLSCTKKYPFIVTNPAFSIFSETVAKCKEVCTDGFILLGKMNFFGAHSRTVDKTWEHLSQVYIFDRQVDYRTPPREDGAFCVGALVTGFFVWDMNWNEDYWLTSVWDVQEYATLGSYENYMKKERLCTVSST